MVHSSTDYVAKATELVAQMSLEEKALLLSGDGWWRTHRIDRLQIPSICMTDGPHGLRKAMEGSLGLGNSVPATCFPTASALASSWDTELIREVGAALAEEAQAAQAAIVFAGLPDSYESEGFDRASIDMPAGHNELIEAVSAVQPNTVVLMNGSAVAMPWTGKVKAILEGWLGGQAGGGAIAEALTGRVNPSGKLSETFPARLEDTPAYPNFPARNKEANYGEGIFIGYRHYDIRKLTPLFPFGFGLSYTTFAYSDLRVSAAAVKDTDGLTVEVNVKNTGPVAGKEVVQRYIHERRPKVVRPEKELKAFTKIALEPGEEQTVRFDLDRRAFAYYDVSVQGWVVNPGQFDLLVGGSSRDLPLKQTVEVQAAQPAHAQLTRYSLLKEFKTHPKGKTFYPELAGAFGMGNPDEPTESTPDLTPEEAAAKKKADMAVRAFLDDMPVYKVHAFSEGRFTEQRLEEILKQVQ